MARERVDALYFTGGSTGLKPLADRIAARFPHARVVRGNRFASVVQGLGVHAQRLFGQSATPAHAPATDQRRRRRQ